MKQSQIIETLVCPKCKSSLEFNLIDKEHFLDCAQCGVSFPVYEGVPMMLIHDAFLKFNNS
jgi:uncharacterized protein YbaR (Trm112 family)